MYHTTDCPTPLPPPPRSDEAVHNPDHLRLDKQSVCVVSA